MSEANPQKQICEMFTASPVRRRLSALAPPFAETNGGKNIVFIRWQIKTFGETVNPLPKGCVSTQAELAT